MSDHMITACNVTHIKQVLCGASCHGLRFSSCFMRSQSCFVFMHAWEKSKNERRERKSRAILRPTDKKAKQPLLIGYNCVYERLRTAQRGRKLLGHESRWLDLHGNLVHSHSGTVTGALEQWHHHFKCHRAQTQEHFSWKMTTQMNCWWL